MIRWILFWNKKWLSFWEIKVFKSVNTLYFSQNWKSWQKWLILFTFYLFAFFMYPLNLRKLNLAIVNGQELAVSQILDFKTVKSICYFFLVGGSNFQSHMQKVAYKKLHITRLPTVRGHSKNTWHSGGGGGPSV